MRKNILSIVSLAIMLFFNSSLNAQIFEWAKSFGGSNYDSGQSITVDASGNVYTTGRFRGTVDFDPGAGTTSLISEGNDDIFVQKMDASGNFLWAKSFGSSSNDRGQSITVDASGNVYTTGYFNGTVDFDPGAGTTSLTSAAASDVFVLKMDASGNFLWAKSFGDVWFESGNSITVDALGSVYTTGYFGGTVDFDPGAGTTSLTSEGNEDIFVQKLDASGNFLWAKSFGGSSNDSGQSITVDASGNVYTTGRFQLTVDFDPGAGTTSLTSAGSLDIFVQKMDASGNFLWAKSFGDIGYDTGNSIIVDALGNVYTTGNFNGTVDFDPGAGTTSLSSAGGRDVFVQKMDASGNFLWAKSFGGSNNNNGNSIIVDNLGSVYTTGSFEGTVDFDPGTGTTSLTSAGGTDVFVQKMDASGNFLWAKSFGGTNYSFGNSITVDPSGNMYTTGYFQLTVDFDPGAGTTSLTPEGSYDIFVQKMSQCQPNSGTELQTACDSYTWIDGNTYTSSNNTATYTLINAAGCDSVVTLDLTILNSTTGTDVQTACDSYTWIDGNTYTADNNTATFTLTNATGCDSIVTLDLTILNSTTGTDVQTACDSYTWIDGNTYTADNNTATFTLTNATGCDSIVTLDLTILNSTTGTDVQTACDSYTWIDGNTYTADNNTATFTLTNAAGCDSVVTLDLTINNVSDITTTVSGVNITANITGASYEWLDCDNNNAVIPGETGQSFSATANGNYAVELTENGCVDTSACVAITTVGLLENTFDQMIRGFPNPTVGAFTIDLGSIYESTHITIRDAIGKIVSTSNHTSTSTIQLAIDEPIGIYFIEIASGDKIAKLKLIKQ